MSTPYFQLWQVGVRRKILSTTQLKALLNRKYTPSFRTFRYLITSSLSPAGMLSITMTVGVLSNNWNLVILSATKLVPEATSTALRVIWTRAKQSYSQI